MELLVTVQIAGEDVPAGSSRMSETEQRQPRSPIRRLTSRIRGPSPSRRICRSPAVASIPRGFGTFVRSRIACRIAGGETCLCALSGMKPYGSGGRLARSSSATCLLVWGTKRAMEPCASGAPTACVHWRRRTRGAARGERAPATRGGGSCGDRHGCRRA